METREKKNSKIQKEIFKEERDKKIRKVVSIISIILILIFSILMYGIFIGAKLTNVNEYKITNDKVPTSFHGIKIVHISDILYNSLNNKDLEKLQKKINDLKADIIVFTGNIQKEDINLDSEDIKLLENFFKNLKASMIKYAVKGNQDDDSFYVIMENSNFTVLNNESTLIYNKDTNPIQIIGFDTTNLKSNSELKKEANYTICFLSNPDEINLVKDKCDLALAGSTLGGEIKLPILNIPLLDNHKYNNYYYQIDNTELYISNGLGNYSNIRLFNHPSINFYRITKY